MKNLIPPILILLIGIFIFYVIWRRQDLTTNQPDLITIEGCQYWKTDTYLGYYTLCHKGNCTNHTAHTTP